MITFYKSIQFKCTLLITSAIFGVGLVSMFIMFRVNTQQLRKTYIEKSNTVMDVGMNYLDEKCENIYNASLITYTDTFLSTLPEQSSIGFDTFAQAKKLLISYCSSNADIHQIHLWCTASGKSLLSGKNTTVLADADCLNPQLEIYDDSLIHAQKSRMSSYYDYDKIMKISYDLMPERNEVISFTRTLYPVHDRDAEPIGSLTIDVRTDAFMNVLNFVFEKELEDFYLLTGNGEILYADTVSGGIPLETLFSAADLSLPVQDGPDGSLIFQSEVHMGDLSFRILKVAYAKNIYHTAFLSFLESLVTLSFAWLLVLITILLIFQGLIGKVAALHQYTVRIRNGETGAAIRDYPNLNHQDEIGVLARTFEESIQSIDRLTKQKYELIIDNKETQLKMLQAQINPHFINNALQAIGNDVFEKEPIYVYELISNLGKMMKYSMNTDHNVVYLQEELDYLTHFLIFQKERIGEKFQYRISASPESTQCIIPKMLIQPLVENSVLHGYFGAKEPFVLDLDVSVYEDSLLISVTDNGIGVPDETLQALNQPASVTRSIGIRNIYRRLSLFYNDRFSFYFEHTKPHGLRSCIRIPRQLTAAQDDDFTKRSDTDETSDH